MILSFFKPGKESDSDQHSKKIEDIPAPKEPNLYELIEQLILEKQELREQITRMGEEIDLLKGEIEHIKKERFT